MMRRLASIEARDRRRTNPSQSHRTDRPNRRIGRPLPPAMPQLVIRVAARDVAIRGHAGIRSGRRRDRQASLPRRLGAPTAFRMNVATHLSGKAHGLRHAIERIDPAWYLGSPYYEHWLISLATGLVENGTIDRARVGRTARGTLRPVRLPSTHIDDPGESSTAHRFALGGRGPRTPNGILWPLTSPRYVAKAAPSSDSTACSRCPTYRITTMARARTDLLGAVRVIGAVGRVA